MTAELLMITDEYATSGPHTCTKNIQGDPETYDCWQIVSSGKSITTKVPSAAVSFQITSGGGSVSSTSDLNNGKYEAISPLAAHPKKAP